VRFASLFRLPVVISCRGGDVHFMTAPRLQGWLIARSLRACQRVFVVSEEMRARVLGLGVDPARVDVVSNGVNAGVFFPRDRARAREELGIPEGAPVVVCVSRLSAEKGIDVLVDAAAKLGVPGARVYVVGDGVMRGALEKRATAAGLGDVITFAGTRPHAEIPVWLAAADVATLASRSEGMPNAVLEALACGRFVVASDVGGVGELITDAEAGSLVPPGDAAALAGALRAALATPHHPERIAAGVKTRTWDAVGRRATDILASLGSSAHLLTPPDVAGGKS
jgi:glycosyltransferase involved in cell wall biosynthesis